MWAAACAFMAWRYPRDVRDAASGPWRGELERGLEAAADDRERVLLVNEILDEVEVAFVRRERWPTVATWLSLGGATMLMAAAATHALHPGIFGALLLGLVGASVCQLARRRGRALLGDARRNVDGVVDELCGDLVGVEVVLPGRRPRRPRRGTRARRSA